MHPRGGQRVIRGVYRADKIYSGDATALAPDLVIGYHRGYRASWATVLGDLTEEILLDNDSVNIRQVPGLGSIPIVGNLFKSTSTIKSTSELIFFVTARIKPQDALTLADPGEANIPQPR